MDVQSGFGGDVERGDRRDFECVLPSVDCAEAVGRALGGQLRAGDLLVLSGALGAGKTTFTRGIAEGMEVRGRASSPTFVIARTHKPARTPSSDAPESPHTSARAGLIHVDAYRLSSLSEFEDLDLDFNRNVVVVEWGERFLPESERQLRLHFERTKGRAVRSKTETTEHTSTEDVNTEDEPRTLRIERIGAGWEHLDWQTLRAAAEHSTR